MHAFVVLGLVFYMPGQEIGLGECLRKMPILCRVGRKILTESITYQSCSVLSCVRQLYTVIRTHMSSS